MEVTISGSSRLIVFIGAKLVPSVGIVMRIVTVRNIRGGLWGPMVDTLCFNRFSGR